MKRAGFSSTIKQFLSTPDESILGRLVETSAFPVELAQRDAWQATIQSLKNILPVYIGRGSIYLEFAIPRLGKRIDALLVIDGSVLVVEFKVGYTEFAAGDINQVCDYALDLKNFHETSHNAFVAPVLIATHAAASPIVAVTAWADRLVHPILSNLDTLPDVILLPSTSPFGKVVDIVRRPRLSKRRWRSTAGTRLRTFPRKTPARRTSR
jgi:hypothetical protein